MRMPARRYRSQFDSGASRNRRRVRSDLRHLGGRARTGLSQDRAWSTSSRRRESEPTSRSDSADQPPNPGRWPTNSAIARHPIARALQQKGSRDSAGRVQSVTSHHPPPALLTDPYRTRPHLRLCRTAR